MAEKEGRNILGLINTFIKSGIREIAGIRHLLSLNPITYNLTNF